MKIKHQRSKNRTDLGRTPSFFPPTNFSTDGAFMALGIFALVAAPTTVSSHSFFFAILESGAQEFKQSRMQSHKGNSFTAQLSMGAPSPFPPPTPSKQSPWLVRRERGMIFINIKTIPILCTTCKMERVEKEAYQKFPRLTYVWSWNILWADKLVKHKSTVSK